MTRVFILAADFSEAMRIAGLAGFKGSIGWDALGVSNTMGTRGVPVLVTAEHCWRSERGPHYAAELVDTMITRDMKMTYVPCPQEWKATGFRLPEGWDVPKEYPARVVLHPPAPRLTWVRRLRQMFGGSDGR